MFALTIDLLTGQYVAKAYNDHNQYEWPPHPARLFSALVATWAEHEPESAWGLMEAQALQWLEEQEAPEIFASAIVGERSVVPVFVPVNDASVVNEPNRAELDATEQQLLDANEPSSKNKAEKAIEKTVKKYRDAVAKSIAAPAKFGKHDGAAGLRVLPETRGKQPRTFPLVVPECAQFAFCWPNVSLSDDLREALAGLMSRLVRLGHSSTLVRGGLEESSMPALTGRTTVFVPDAIGGTLTIRWVQKGQLDALVAAFHRHRETEPRVLPAAFMRYREGRAAAQTEIPSTVFGDELIIFTRVSGPRLPITSTAGLAKQVRRVVMSYADEPIDEMISGPL